LSLFLKLGSGSGSASGWKLGSGFASNKKSEYVSISGSTSGWKVEFRSASRWCGSTTLPFTLTQDCRIQVVELQVLHMLVTAFLGRLHLGLLLQKFFDLGEKKTRKCFKTSWKSDGFYSPRRYLWIVYGIPKEQNHFTPRDWRVVVTMPWRNSWRIKVYFPVPQR
jgi:hypothetical protein